MTPKRAADYEAEESADKIEQIKGLILDYRRRHARTSRAEMARAIHVSDRTAARHEDDLLNSGILKFVAVVDHDRTSTFGVHALVEITFPGDADVGDCLKGVLRTVNRKELREAMTLIGDVDAQIRVRARTVADLRGLVMQIRQCESVLGTKTRIVAGSWHHAVTDVDEAAL